MRSASLVIGASLVAAVVLVATFAPWFASLDPDVMDMGNRLAGPSRDHVLGTDNFGRDLWSRIAYGARVSLAVGLGSVALATLIGAGVGLVSGYCGGLVDRLFMRVVDLFLGFPPFVLAMALVAALDAGAWSVGLALAAVFWTEVARLVRGITLAEVERDHVAAARAMGASPLRVILRHVLPRVAGPLSILSTLAIGTAIVSEAGLSFLGFGVQPPTPTWGWTLSYGMQYLRTDMWLATVPGLAIMLTVLGFNLLGDGLRDRLDPKGRLRHS